MPGTIDLYLSDLSAATEVTMTKQPDGKFFVAGLPILKPGTWNGKDYTAQDMQAAADAFAEIQATDKWEPPLRPYHAYDREGHPVAHSAQETLGWHKGMRWDETAGLLRADFEIVDAAAAADIVSGKLRFASTEVARGGAYTSPTTGKAYDTAIVGTAFVDNPAVKDMPWQVVLNAAEFGHAGDEGGEAQEPEAPPATPPPAEAVVDVAQDAAGTPGNKAGTTGAKGAKSMGLIETLKARYAALGAKPEDLVELDTLSEAPPVDPPAPTPPATPPAPPADPAVAAQLEQLSKANEELRGTVETMAAETRRTKAAATVDGWVSGGKLPPALRVSAFALVDALSASAPVSIDVLAQDEEGKQTTRQATSLDLLGEIITGMAPITVGKPKGVTLTLETDDPTPAAMTPDEIKSIAALAGGGK